MSILADARKAAGLTQEELAEKVDATRITIVRLEKKDGISRKWAEKLSPILNVPVESLLIGRPVEQPSTILETGNVDRTSIELAPIPIRGEVAAGLWREYDELSQDLGEPTEYAPTAVLEGYPKEQQFALRVRGESLNKIAPDGSVLHCLEYINGDAWHIKDGDLVVVQRSKYQGAMIETTAKRVRKNGEIFELWPESNHPDFQEPLIVPEVHKAESAQEIRIFAKVLRIIIEP